MPCHVDKILFVMVKAASIVGACNHFRFIRPGKKGAHYLLIHNGVGFIGILKLNTKFKKKKLK